MHIHLSELAMNKVIDYTHALKLAVHTKVPRCVVKWVMNDNIMYLIVGI